MVNGECDKCGEVPKYEMETYHRMGEDTYDFQLCHTCEPKLWNGNFLQDDASFGYDEEDEDEDE